jgi:nucleoside-triphosphatase
LTGQPGIGKTTIVERLASHFSSHGVRIGGFTTSEVRESGQRVGFKIADLSSRHSGWLSRKDNGEGPRIGSYRVITEDLEKFGVTSLERAIADPVNLILIDEIGPMEMTSASFRRSITRVFSAHKPTLATVKLGSRYPEVENVRDSCLQFEITFASRDSIYQKLVDRVENWIRPSGTEVI